MADFSASSLLVPFGRTAAGEIVTPAQVPRGLACGCTCPGCQGALVANQGERKAWHFSHQANSDCKTGYESAIHAATKQLLMREKRIMLPSLTVRAYPHDLTHAEADQEMPRAFGNLQLFSGRHEFHHYMEARIGRADSKARMIEFDAVIEEQKDGDIKPDIIGIVGDRRLYIEVAATHFVDREKEQKIRDRGLAVVEIRVPYEKGVAPDFELLSRLLLTEAAPAEKYWISSPAIEGRALADLEKREAAYQAKREREDRIRAARAERYEKHYKATHQLLMFNPLSFPRVFAKLRLCPSFISLRVSGGQNKVGFEVINEVARAYRGKFDKSGEQQHWQWKIQPVSVEMFVAVAQSLKERGLTRIRQEGSYMPGEDADWIMPRLI